jgi:hypothetical protein
MTDILIDSNCDIDIADGPQLVSEIDQVAQHAKTRMQTFLGECAFNTTIGVRWFEDIFVKAPNKELVDSLIKATLLDTPGVFELLKYDSTYDARARTLVISCEINTTFGPITLEELAL